MFLALNGIVIGDFGRVSRKSSRKLEHSLRKLKNMFTSLSGTNLSITLKKSEIHPLR
jgi:hypothetical protein